MTLVIPTREAETLRNDSSNRLWPVGAWKGTIESSDMRDLPRSSKTGELFKGYVGPEGERLALVIGENVPLDGQGEVGGQKQFVDLVFVDGPYSLETTPYDSIPDEAWQLKRSARYVANLAAALGQITMLDDERAAVNDGFLEALKSGAYNGQEIGYVIYHRTGKDKVTRAEIEMFIAA
jgi:hypothetical protein